MFFKKSICIVIIFSIFFSNIFMLKVSASDTFDLSKKTTIVIGDSIMLGSGNGDRSFDYYLKKQYKTKIIKNYAVGGATIINTNKFKTKKQKCISSQIDKLIYDINNKNIKVDKNTVILIDGGINDVVLYRDFEEFKIGTYKNKDNNKTCIPKIKSYIDKLRKEAPDSQQCKIIFLVQYANFSSDHFYDSKPLYNQYKKELKKYCNSKKYLTYLDVSKYINNGYTIDGIHLKSSGYKKITLYLANQIKKI